MCWHVLAFQHIAALSVLFKKAQVQQLILQFCHFELTCSAKRDIIFNKMRVYLHDKIAHKVASFVLENALLAGFFAHGV